MNPLVISIAAVAILTSTAFYSVYKNTEEVKSKIETSNSLNNAQKMSTIQLEPIKLSTLAQNSLDDNEKIRLNRFQEAINQAIIKENIQNPTCTDLAATGFITNTECLEIKDKLNNYATISKGKMKLDDSQMKNIIKNQIAFKSIETNTTSGEDTIQPYNKLQNKLKINIVRQTKKKENIENKTIAQTAEPEMIAVYAKSINDKVEHTIEVNQKIMQLQQFTAAANRIQQIEEVNNAKITKTDNTEVQTPLEQVEYISYIPTQTFVDVYINKEKRRQLNNYATNNIQNVIQQTNVVFHSIKTKEDIDKSIQNIRNKFKINNFMLFDKKEIKWN